MNVAKQNTSKKSKLTLSILLTSLFLMALTAKLPVFHAERAAANAETKSTENPPYKDLQTEDSAKIPGDLLATIQTAADRSFKQDVILQFDEKLSSKNAETIRNVGGTVQTKLDGINALLASVPRVNISP